MRHVFDDFGPENHTIAIFKTPIKDSESFSNFQEVAILVFNFASNYGDTVRFDDRGRCPHTSAILFILTYLWVKIVQFQVFSFHIGP